MIRLKDTGHANTAEFLQNAIRIAEYYGFVPMDDMKAQTREKDEAARKVQKEKSETEISFARRDERALATVARRAVSVARANHGTLLAWRTTPGQTDGPTMALELHVVGSQSAIAEAILLVVAN